MPGNITIHIEATSAWERAKPFLAQGGVNTAFLLNANPEQIQYALDHVSGIVVVRVYDPFSERSRLGHEFEKDIILRHNPGDFVNWLNGQDLSRFKGNKRVRFILGWNEMFYAGPDYQRKQNKAMIDVAAALIKADYGVALFGLAADKTIQHEDCQNGVWDETVKFLQDNGDWAHLDYHEYELGRMASQHLKSYPTPYPRSIEDPNSMRTDNWGIIPYAYPENKNNWHVGRIAWMLERGDFYHARGEYGSDYKDDGALRQYVPEYMGRYPKPQGYNSLRPLFNTLCGKILSDKEFCEEIYKDLVWAASYDHPMSLSNAIFADNPSSEHAAFNIGLPQYDHLRYLLGQQIKPIPVPPPIEIPPEEAPMLVERRIKSTVSATNIRILPDKNSSLAGNPVTSVFAIGKVEADYAVAQLVTDILKPEAWVEIEISGVTGYAAARYLVIEEIPSPEEEPEFEVDFTIRMTPSVRAAFQEIAESLANAKLDE